MTKKRLLVLSMEVSGMNKYLFSGLKNQGWELTVENISIPSICRQVSIISSFSLSMSRWKKQCDEKFMKFGKTGWMFKKMTRQADMAVKKHKGNFDLIFQISGMFAPFLELIAPSSAHRSPDNKYVLMLSYTTFLSNDYPGWAPFRHELKKRLSLEWVVYNNAEFIFTTNENAQKSLINHYDVSPEKIKTVGYGLTIEGPENFEKEYDGKTILFIGMDFERKGGFVLLEAFRQVRKEIPDAKLIIIGPNKDIYDIREPGVESLGHLNDKQAIKGFYEKSSIFVMPSLCEPFGLVFLEAMAHKLPCIGTNRDAMPEIIQDGKNGFLVPTGDSQSLAEKIIFLLKNTSHMKQLGDYAQRHVREHFLWEKTTERIDGCLKNII